MYNSYTCPMFDDLYKTKLYKTANIGGNGEDGIIKRK